MRDYQRVLENILFLAPVPARMREYSFTTLETGNHIAQNGDGNLRRETTQRFVFAVKGASSGEAPWRPVVFPLTEEILLWIDTLAWLWQKKNSGR